MQTQTVGAAQRLRAIAQQRKDWAVADSDPVALPLLAALSRCVETCAGGVQIQRLQLSPPVEQATKTAPSALLRSLVLSGTASSDDAILTFVHSLKSEKSIAKVDIKSLTSGAAPGSREWRLECGL
jgi:Tfp pilus assembly protein PilN